MVNLMVKVKKKEIFQKKMKNMEMKMVKAKMMMMMKKMMKINHKNQQNQIEKKTENIYITQGDNEINKDKKTEIDKINDELNNEENKQENAELKPEDKKLIDSGININIKNKENKKAEEISKKLTINKNQSVNNYNILCKKMKSNKSTTEPN